MSGLPRIVQYDQLQVHIYPRDNGARSLNHVLEQCHLIRSIRRNNFHAFIFCSGSFALAAAGREVGYRIYIAASCFISSLVPVYE